MWKIKINHKPLGDDMKLANFAHNVWIVDGVEKPFDREPDARRVARHRFGMNWPNHVTKSLATN